MVGATLTCEDGGSIVKAEEFGLYFGMVYQLMDDYIDGDPILLKSDGIDEMEKFSRLAINCLKDVQASIYKDKLADLLNYVRGLAHIEKELKCRNK